jgi:hypothetical protein
MSEVSLWRVLTASCVVVIVDLHPAGICNYRKKFRPHKITNIPLPLSLFYAFLRHEDFLMQDAHLLMFRQKYA